MVSGAVAVAGQVRITRWLASRWDPGGCLVIGMAVLTVSFVPLAAVASADRWGLVPAVAALLASAALLAVGSAAVFPFEMDTVVVLSGNRLVATHYGFYNTVVGVGILLGNVATGSLIQLARDIGLPELSWVVLIVVGAVPLLGLYGLNRSGRLQPVQTDLRW